MIPVEHQIDVNIPGTRSSRDLTSRALDWSPRRPWRAAGFTLIEILVALTILSLVLVAAQQVFSGGMSAISRSERYGQASLAARSILSELALRDDLEPGQSFSGRIPDTPDPLFEWSAEISEHEEDDLPPAREMLLIPLRAHIEMRWQTGQREQGLELDTLLLVQSERRGAGGRSRSSSNSQEQTQ